MTRGHWVLVLTLTGDFGIVLLILWGLWWILLGGRRVRKRILIEYEGLVLVPIVWLPVLIGIDYFHSTGSWERMYGIVFATLVIIGALFAIRFVGEPIVYNINTGGLRRGLDQVLHDNDISFRFSIERGKYIVPQIKYYLHHERVSILLHTKNMRYISESYPPEPILLAFEPRLRAFKAENIVVRGLKKELGGKTGTSRHWYSIVWVGMGIFFIIFYFLAIL